MTETWDWRNVRVRELQQDGLPKKGEPFAVLTLVWAAKAAAATASPKAMVWIWLVQQARKTGRNSIAVSNEGWPGMASAARSKQRRCDSLRRQA